MVPLTVTLLSVIAGERWMATGSGSQGTGPVIWLGGSIISGTERALPTLLSGFSFLNFVN